MDEYFLLLYIDRDYIIPVIDTVKGDLHHYKSGVESRMWLYFREDFDTTDVIFGQDNYRSARLKKDGYFGNYWNQVAKNESVNIHGTTVPYVKLIKMSGILSSLTKWYEATTQKTAVSIPTICIFSDSITNDARKSFLKFISKEKFSVRSYSKSFNSLVAAYCNKLGRMSSDFGTRMVVINALGERIQLSSMIFWNDVYTDCDKPIEVSYDGENPVLMALAKHVVDKNNRDNSFLRPEQITTEYIYQMQYAPAWLAKAARVSDEESFLIEYHLSIDPDIKYSLNISKSFITNKQKELSRPITDGIERYCADIDLSSVSQYIYIGEMFASKEMYKMCSKHAPQKSFYITYSHYAEILHLYLENYGLPSENISDFDKLMAQRISEREAATAWVNMADIIVDIQNKSTAILKDFKEILDRYFIAFETMNKAVSLALETSDFQKADTIVNDFLNESKAVRMYVQQTVSPLLNEDQCNLNRYESVSAYPYAKNIIGHVSTNVELLLDCVKNYDTSCLYISKKEEQINHFRNNYPLYCKLRERFKNLSMLHEKRQILVEMKTITGESLPEDLGEADSVNGNISYDIEFEKKLFGFKKTASSLTLKIKIGDIPLPYACVLLISDRSITSLNRRFPQFEIKRGSTGVISQEFKLPFEQFPKTNTLVARVMIDTEKEHLVDISKISFNNLYIQLK